MDTQDTNKIETVYLVETVYAGPNPQQMRGKSRWMDIQREPGETNSSGEARVDGWLGTTNDWARYGRGSYASEAAARLTAKKLGFSHSSQDDSGELGGGNFGQSGEAADGRDLVIDRIHADADPEVYDASDYLDGVSGDIDRRARKGQSVRAIRRGMNLGKPGDDIDVTGDISEGHCIVDGDEIDQYIAGRIEKARIEATE